MANDDSDDDDSQPDDDVDADEAAFPVIVKRN